MDKILHLKNLLFFLLLVHHCVGPPTKNKGPGENTQNGEEKEKPPSLDDFGLEYNRYLKEVVDALESDPEFRKKLETADEADFRNGKVAAELDYVNHHVRTKLDELKRTELQRLRDLVKQAEEIEKNEVNPNHVNPGHVDHTNPHTFEAADLHKLITQVRKDLAEADRKRREEFKQYELEKKFEQEQALKAMDEEHRKQYLEQVEKQKQRHLEQSRKVNHPGSRHQLEGVWETQDQMHDQKFNPRTFFLLHDINGDGYWDEDEVKALFKGELDKLYQAGAPLEDMRERLEEMERMREHVFKESDTNGDRLISYEEFLEQTKKPEFQSGKDEGWEPIDAQPQFTQQEYEEFERRRQQEVQHLIDQGLIQHYPYPPGMMPPGYEHHPGQFQQAYQHPGAGHPNQIPQHQQQYAQNVAHHPQGVPPQAQYAHMPQGSHQYPAQHYPNQMPQHPNQLPRSNQPAVQSNQIPQSQPAPPQQNQGNQNIPQQPSNNHPQQNNPVPQQQQLYQQQAQQPNQQQYQQQAQQPNQQQYQQQAQQPNQQQYQQQAQQPNQQQYQQQAQQLNQQQYHHDPNQIIPPNPNQQILQNQQAPNYIPNQQAPSPNHNPSNQIPNQQIHASKQIPSQQAPVNAQQLNQVPQNQAGQQTNQGAYGSISMQQGANYQQNNIHTDGNKSPSKDIPPKR